jgi:hypothetical protein
MKEKKRRRNKKRREKKRKKRIKGEGRQGEKGKIKKED